MRRAFTLIELLIVIGIVAVLLAIVIIALNPKRQFDNARGNAKLLGARQLLDALMQCYADHRGNWLDNCYRLVSGANNVPATCGTWGCFSDARTTYLTANTPNYNNFYHRVLIGGLAYPQYYSVDFCPLVQNGYLPRLPCDPDNYSGCSHGGGGHNCSTSNYYTGHNLIIVNSLITLSVHNGNSAIPLYTGPTSVTRRL